MQSTNSMLHTILTRSRMLLDEEVVAAKYSDDFFVRHLLTSAQVDVLSRINNTYSNPVVIRYAVTITSEEEYYVLPPSIQEIWMIAVLDDDQLLPIMELSTRSFWNSAGPGWQIEGNLLSLRPKVEASKDVHIFYVPNGDCMPHYSSEGGSLDATKKIVTLDLTPDTGVLDQRVNAYAGMMLRILPTDDSPVEQQPIESMAWSGSAWTVTVRVAYTYASAGSIGYEVVPMGMESMADAISARCAMKLGQMRSVSEKKMRYMKEAYQGAIKTLGDNFTHMNLRRGKYYEKDTFSNPGASIGFFGIYA